MVQAVTFQEIPISNLQKDMRHRYYQVAGHCFCIEAEESVFVKMQDYVPFLTDEPSSVLFKVTVQVAPKKDIAYVKDTYIDQGILAVTTGHTSAGQDVYIYQWNSQDLFWLVCEDQYRKGTLTMTGLEPKMALDMAITIIYRYTAIKWMTTAIHASAVSYQGQAYLFLGISGTGKSTHSRLWLKHFEGAELINDDKPIIRVFEDGEVRVYGSPWSGKTPCYRNIDYPLGGMVKLKQANHNSIRRLRNVETYYVLLHSIFGRRWDKDISDALHALEERLVSLIPMWQLECLPDEEAARLCKDTITKGNNN